MVAKLRCGTSSKAFKETKISRVKLSSMAWWNPGIQNLIMNAVILREQKMTAPLNEHTDISGGSKRKLEKLKHSEKREKIKLKASEKTTKITKQ